MPDRTVTDGLAYRSLLRSILPIATLTVRRKVLGILEESRHSTANVDSGGARRLAEAECPNLETQWMNKEQWEGLARVSDNLGTASFIASVPIFFGYGARLPSWMLFVLIIAGFLFVAIGLWLRHSSEMPQSALDTSSPRSSGFIPTYLGTFAGLLAFAMSHDFNGRPAH